MGTLALNKSSLKSERDRLETFERFLPSLDLKRQQLLAEFKRAERILADRRDEIERMIASLEGLLALVGCSTMDLSGFVKVRDVQIGEENVIGARLPVLREVQFTVEEYSTLAKPFWVDTLVEYLQKMSELRIHEQVEAERVARLGEAVRKITQRVNLFEKVLIPTTQENILRIRIYLGDAERAAVVRSKIVKTKRQQKSSRREQGSWR
jgi:V/A-type H+-transporting ATPase subunit D